MKTTFIIFVFLGLTGIAYTSPNDSANSSKTAYVKRGYEEKVNAAQLLMSQLIEEKKIPGLSITIAYKNELIWAEGFGYSDLENMIPVLNETKFRIGSISKSLTSLALGRLLESGQINLSDNVQKYVPYFPDKKFPITIGQLASHTAGIRDYNYKKGEYLSDKKYNSVKESIDIFKDDSLLFEPGTEYRYSTYGYVLLSGAIEGATGMSFIDYMRDSVIIPLQLNNTLPDKSDELVENRSKFYDISEGNIVNSVYVDNSNKWAGGGYLSTSHDLVKLAQSLLNNTFLDVGTREILWTPAVLSDGKKLNYCIGWRRDTDSLYRTFMHHGGNSMGGRSFLLVYPVEGLAIAITSNLSTDFNEKFVSKLANVFLE